MKVKGDLTLFWDCDIQHVNMRESSRVFQREARSSPGCASKQKFTVYKSIISLPTLNMLRIGHDLGSKLFSDRVKTNLKASTYQKTG